MITRNQYDEFLKNILEEIDSDWVIIGGSLLAIIHASDRSTADIDICPLNEMTNEHRLLLMNVAVRSGLPIEVINPGADFFLRQIPNWKASLILFKSGKKGNLFRPSLELYLKLKLNRGSDTDIADCISFIIWYKKNSLEINIEAIKNILASYDSEKTKKILEKIKDLCSQSEQ